MRDHRILLAAPASGSGKTMLTCGILQALHDRGLRVSSLKCGPDFIDPMFHEKVIGIRSGNLDLFFSDEETLRRLFCQNVRDAEISVIEGVMGYYDGLGAASDEASTYRVAQALKAPVILIVNARGQSLSALATLEGFLRFRPDSGIRAVIFNQMSEHVFLSLRDEVRKLGVIPLGYVPRTEELVVGSRHLGLVMPDEIKDISPQGCTGLRNWLKRRSIWMRSLPLRAMRLSLRLRRRSRCRKCRKRKLQLRGTRPSAFFTETI